MCFSHYYKDYPEKNEEPLPRVEGKGPNSQHQDLTGKCCGRDIGP